MTHDHTRHARAHDHSSACSHGPGGHNHTPAVTDGNERRVFWVMVLTGTFMVVEALGGMISGSLALLADAGHMLTDTAALMLAFLAFRLARKPADAKRSYGYHRFQILAAFANALALFGIALWIMVEAVHRLMTPVEIAGIPMIAIAALGLLVNIIGFWVLSRGDHSNMNVRGAALHVLGDLLGSVAAIAAAVIILLTGWTPIDPILSILVCILILRSAWVLIRQSAHILLQGMPVGFDVAEIETAVLSIGGVSNVHHVHAWSLTDNHPVITLHAIITPEADHCDILAKINQTLKSRFDIMHATVQIERAGQECPNPCPV